MLFRMQQLSAQQCYKILTATITPRPIAWVTTRSRDGVMNAAPFSFFNVMGDAPPLLALGIQGRPGGGLKDTARNILDGGDFVVHLVSSTFAEAMNVTSAQVDPAVDELELAELTTVPGTLVEAPRILSVPVAFECRKSTIIASGAEQIIVIGEVLAAHVDDKFVLDAEACYIDTPKLDLIARMHGRGWYVRSPEWIQMVRPGYERDPDAR